MGKNRKTDTTSVTSVSAKFKQDIINGSLLDIVFKQGGRHVLFITDNLGNTFTRISRNKWTCFNAIGGSTEITATFSRPVKAKMKIKELLGKKGLL